MPGSGTWVPLVLLPLVEPPELELEDDELELEEELDEDELLELFQPEVELVPVW